jgi:hypothetical protein
VPAASSAPGAGVRIVAPRPLNDRGEWRPPYSEAGFLCTTPVLCAVDPAGGPVHWRVTVYRGGRPAGTLTGSGRTFTFRPADAEHGHLTGPVAVEITAEPISSSAQPRAPDAPDEEPDCERQSEADAPAAGSQPGAGAVSAVSAPRPASTANAKSAIPGALRAPQSTLWIRQDEVDQLRQEYLDLPGRNVNLAPRSAFIDRGAYEQDGGLLVPWPDLNRTQREDGGAYDHILLTAALREGLRRWQQALGSRALEITSGFRNPVKQRLTNGRGGREGAPGSMHQYGRAVDVRASLRRDFRDWVQVAWAALDAGADYVETAPEGGWNHVHADWRHDGQGPPLTVKLEIAGRVLDADGNSVPAARVVGSSDTAGGTEGMPAWEGPDAEGRFLLRTVWHPGRPYRLRAVGEGSAALLALTVPEGATGLVHLETDLTLLPESLRAALARRSVRLASRGWRGRISPRRRRSRRG